MTAFQHQIAAALAWLLTRTQTEPVKEVIASYRAVLKEVERAK
jgi:hypothetical protein